MPRKRELQALQNFKNRQLARSETLPKQKEWLEKMPNEFGRLSLAFHFIQWAALPDKERGSRPPNMISRYIARMARRFLEEFIYPHAFDFYGRLLGRCATDDHAIWIGEHILTHRRQTISNREIMQSYSALSTADKHIGRLAAMATLETHGWVIPAAYKKDGSSPTAWKVNPAVHDGRFADVKAREEARRAAVREAIARNGAPPTSANRRQQSPTDANAPPLTPELRCHECWYLLARVACARGSREAYFLFFLSSMVLACPFTTFSPTSANIANMAVAFFVRNLPVTECELPLPLGQRAFGSSTCNDSF